MNTEKVTKLIKDHHLAASIAFALVGGCIVMLMPDDIHHLDLSETDNKLAIVNAEGRLLHFFSWEYTTHIDKVNGWHSFDKFYGLPDLVILDAGFHELDVGCSWKFLNTTWVRSEHQIGLEALPNKVYQLQSLRTPRLYFWGDCVVYAVELGKSNKGLLTENQNKYLEKYDLDQIVY